MHLKTFIKYIIYFGLLLVFSGCSTKELDFELKDIKLYKQDPSIYSEAKNFSDEEKNNNIKKFLDTYFYPWDLNQTTYTLEEAMWSHTYTKQNVYGENYRLIKPQWFDKIYDNANYEMFNMICKKAIVITPSHLRVFPSNSTIFYDPKKAGEGFPFDYNENTSIKINTPLFISHFSKDGLWAFVESNIALGWIELKNIAFVNDEFINIFKTNKYGVSIKDNVILKKKGFIQEYAQMSTLFPIAKKGFVIAGKDFKNDAFIKVIDENEFIKPLGLDFNNDNIKLITDTLVSQPYGWGGLLGNRDCSLLTRDFFIPFGKFLPRNSASQSKIGKKFDLSKLDDNEKREFILKNAIPYKTLVYLKGHIMLYIGNKDNEPLVFHNVWGVRVKENSQIGRKIIGKAVVTSLEPGKELDNYIDDKSILKRILSINILQ